VNQQLRFSRLGLGAPAQALALQFKIVHNICIDPLPASAIIFLEAIFAERVSPHAL
jgi:hypothetical protein